MIGQAILSLLLFGVLVYAWGEYRRAPIVAATAVAVALVGLFFVWVPSESTRVAELVGIGRGADLILYLWVCISLIVLLNLHLKLRTQQEMITELARRIALAHVVSSSHEPTRALSAIAPLQAAPPVGASAHRSRQMDDQIA